MSNVSLLYPQTTNASTLLAKARDTVGTTTSISSTSSSAGGSSQTSLNSLGATFLQLLTQELQNQDPTAPVDSTQMVGQMISLNQLDQLASIDQLLTTAFSSTGSSASTTGAASGGVQSGSAGHSANPSTVAALQSALAGMNSENYAASGLSSSTSSLL